MPGETRIVDEASLGGYSGEDIPEPDLLKACVHCGMCLSSCPTYRVTGQEVSSPRGRLWLMSAVAEDRLSVDDPIFVEQMYQCLDCRACEAVCPSGVEYGKLVERSRRQIELHVDRPLKQRVARKVMLDWTFADTKRIEFMGKAARAYKRSGAQAVVRKSGLLEKTGMAEYERMTPEVDKNPLEPGKEAWTADSAGAQAHLFNGCIMGTVFANTNRAAGRVLAKNGVGVDVPTGQGCCGALLVHSGMFDQARALARTNIDSFESANGDPIVVTAAGCGSTLKEYGYLLKEDAAYAERAEIFSKRVVDLTELLAEHQTVEPGRLDKTVTYQDACHLAHAQRVTDQPRKLINSIPGITVVEMRDSDLCCGSAGIYNILRPEMARELGQRKVDNTIATRADEVITANPGCAMQLQSTMAMNGANIRVRHIADLMDEAYSVLDKPDGESSPADS